MKLIVTENLLSDLEEFGISEKNYIKISNYEFNNYDTPLFDSDVFNFVYDEFLQITDEIKSNLNFYKNFIFQIKKSNLIKFSDVSQNIEILYSNLKIDSINPWDLTNSIYNIKKNYEHKVLQKYTDDENAFKSFLSYLTKELVRVKLMYNFDDYFISKHLNEKLDFKYKDSLSKKNKINEIQINKSLFLINKVENNLMFNNFDAVVAKRFLIAIKKILET